MTDMRSFIEQAAAMAVEPDAQKRAANELEIARRINSLPSGERQRFEIELPAMVKAQGEKLPFRQKWIAAERVRALKPKT